MEQFNGASTRIIYPNDESYRRFATEAYPLLARGKKAAFEIEMRKGDGSLFWCRLEGTALDSSKTDDGSIWIWEDITERRQAEEELRRLTKLQSVILNNSTVGIAIVRNRRIEWANATVSELFGIPHEQLPGTPTRIVYPSDDGIRKDGRRSSPSSRPGEEGHAGNGAVQRGRLIVLVPAGGEGAGCLESPGRGSSG